MKKLRLELEDVRIESFETSSVRAEKGTVFGEQQWSRPGQASCNGDETCANTCGPVCDSLHTCDHFTCAGFVSRWGQDAFCVYC